MSALWTPGRAGASPEFVRHGPAPPSRVLLHHSPSDVCAGFRWSWLDAGPAQNWLELARVGLLHEGRDLLAKGCAYCTKAPPTRSTPNSRPVAPHPRAVHPGGAGSHRTDRVSPSGRLKQQLSRPAGAPTPSLSPRSCLMARDRGFRGRPRDLTYDRGRWGGAAEVGRQAWNAGCGCQAGGGPTLQLPILSRPDSRLTHAYREQGHGPGVGLVSLVSTCSQRHLSAALRHPSPPPDERSRTERVPRRNY